MREGDDRPAMSWVAVMAALAMVCGGCFTMPGGGSSGEDDDDALDGGTQCYLWLAGMLAADGEQYTVYLWMTDP